MQAQRFDPSLSGGGLSLVLLDDQGIAPVQAAYFGTETPTDVISFRYQTAPGEEEPVIGEILVNIERAHREGHRRRGGPGRELALYIAHGCDHLAGFDDATPTQRASMRRRELAWLRRADREGLLEHLVAEERTP